MLLSESIYLLHGIMGPNRVSWSKQPSRSRKITEIDKQCSLVILTATDCATPCRRLKGPGIDAAVMVQKKYLYCTIVRDVASSTLATASKLYRTNECTPIETPAKLLGLSP